MSTSSSGLDLFQPAYRKPIHIAIGSTISRPGNAEANLAEIEAFARRAARDCADILLTPELSACGYGSWPDVMALAERAGEGPIFARLAGIARDTGVVVCAGFPERYEDKTFIAHYTVYPDGHFTVQRKHRALPSEAPFEAPVPLLPRAPGEDQGQPAATQFNTFEVKGVRCAVAICYDSGITNLHGILDGLGVELLLIPTGAGGKREDRFSVEELRTEEGRARYTAYMQIFVLGGTPAACIKHRRALAAVNICGYDGRKYYHGGNGSIFNCFGEQVAYTPFIAVLERQRPMYAHAVVDIQDTIEQK